MIQFQFTIPDNFIVFIEVIVYACAIIGGVLGACHFLLKEESLKDFLTGDLE